MQVPARKTPTSRFALAIVAAALISALFAFAVPAQAEPVDEVAAAPGAVAETSASAEPVSAPIDVPESVEAPEATSATDSAEATVESTPAPTPTADQVSAATSSAADSVPTANLSDAVPAAPVDVSPPVGIDADPDATVPPAVHRVSRLVERTAQSSAGTVAPQQLSEVAAPARRSLDSIAPALSEDGLPAAFATPPGSGHGASPGDTPSFSVPSPTGAFPGHRVEGTESSQAKYSAGFGGVESLWLKTLGNLWDSAASRSLSAAIGLLSATIVAPTDGRPGAVEHFNDPAPLDGPGPLPESPGAAAPGSGGSFFVPIAALLALLALVAPATFRRRREVPDFTAPTPFVCALERPG